jgi:hypothetical protein
VSRRLLRAILVSESWVSFHGTVCRIAGYSFRERPYALQ